MMNNDTITGYRVLGVKGESSIVRDFDQDERTTAERLRDVLSTFCDRVLMLPVSGEWVVVA